MATHKIRTTIEPDQEVEVGDAELTDLRRQGLVLDNDKDATQADTDDVEESE